MSGGIGRRTAIDAVALFPISGCGNNSNRNRGNRHLPIVDDGGIDGARRTSKSDFECTAR